MQGQQQQIKFSLPVALRKHYEFLKNLRTKEIADYGQSVQTDFAVPGGITNAIWLK